MRIIPSTNIITNMKFKKHNLVPDVDIYVEGRCKSVDEMEDEEKIMIGVSELVSGDKWTWIERVRMLQRNTWACGSVGFSLQCEQLENGTYIWTFNM